MTFRRRLIALSAAAVATAVVLGSVATYVIVRADLRSGVDHQLRQLGAVVLTAASAPSAANDSSSLNARLRQVVLDPHNRAKLNALLGPTLFSYVTKRLTEGAASGDSQSRLGVHIRCGGLQPGADADSAGEPGWCRMSQGRSVPARRRSGQNEPQIQALTSSEYILE